MSYIGALGNDNDINGNGDNSFSFNNSFNFNDLNIRIVDIDTSNYARFLDSNSSNYTDEIGLNSSNYTDYIGLNSSNYTDYIGLNSSNYTDEIGINSSNYTDEIISNLSSSEDSSNYTDEIALNSSNYTDKIGFNSSNYCDMLDEYSSNYTKRIKNELSQDINNFEINPDILGSVSLLGSITGFFTGTNSIYGTIAIVATVAEAAQSTANSATSKANDAQDDADNAQDDVDIALSIWNKGTTFEGNSDDEAYDHTDNIYHLQTGNVGIGVPNDTELTHKLQIDDGGIKITTDDTAITIYNNGIENEAKMYISSLLPEKDLSIYAYSATNDMGIRFITDGGDTKMRITKEGNVGIGTTNPEHKLFVNGTTKLNDDVTLNGSLEIENLNANTFLRFYNYSDATTVKQSGFIYLSDYTEVFAMDTASLPIELRIGTYPIIQVYSDKVDITKNLNVEGDITFTGNLYDGDGIFTGGTTYDDTNRLNYEFLKEPTTFNETIGNIEEPTIIQDANIEEPTFTQPANIEEPTTSESPITIDSDHKYISFPYTSGATETSYDITFNEDTECDILIVAGGGGGGTSYSSGSTSTVPGGGGGAGGLIFLETETISSGTYTIKVGKGGAGDDYSDSTAP